MERATLVFPSSMSAALIYSRKAKERGEHVLAASSVKADETAKLYDRWVFLPSIYENDFADTLAATIEHHKITHFYTPHAVIYSAMERLIRERNLPITMEDASPIETLNAQYLETIARADSAQSFIRAIATASLPLLSVASLFHHAQQIYGQTNESKIAALAAAFASAPKGDIIEIGSAWGRSAFVLAFLAQHYHIGNVLAIDPWDEDAARQKESSENLEKVNKELDWDLMFKIFLIHMLPMATHFNYMRCVSANGEKAYAANRHVHSPEFGKISYTGNVSVIHIDGNHDHESVAADYAAWRPHIVPGGWLILDDYFWEHGTGPRLVGDRLLKDEKDAIALSFTSGKALFVKYKEQL